MNRSMKSLALYFSLAVVLSACGGSGPDSASPSATDEASSDRAQALATTPWSLVANENQSFDVATTSTVRYGAGNAWVTKSVTGRVSCSNYFFGSDPAFGVVKRCEVQSGATAAAGGWTYLTNEGSSYAVAGTRTVRYGADNAWLQATITNSGACTNGAFGSDPLFGVVKRCEVWTDATAAPQPIAPTPAPAPAPAPAPTPAPSGARSNAAIMVSGHSLTSHGIFANMESVANSLGTPMAWNEQNIGGSPIRVRTRGNWLDDPSFAGYRSGNNRYGANMDIVAEFLNPQSLGGQRYDTLVLTERHDIVNTLMWEDTVRYTRHYQDRLVAGNGAANGYLYHSWLPINNKYDPSSWIGYERTVAKAWQCTAARVNVSLAAAGRGDRMTYLPAGIALADLLEQAVYGWVPGISGGGAGATVDRLFTDSLHLTPVGEYYLSLVSYASVYRRSPVGAAVPYGVTAEQASSLQNIAWQAVSNHYNNASVPSMDQCQAAMRDQVCSAYANYSGNPGLAGGCSARFSEQSQNNPFYGGNDSGYWFQ
jgi:hypothetical protein